MLPTIIPLQDCPQHLSILAEWHHSEWSYLNPALSLEARVEKMQAYINDDAIPNTWVMLNEDNQPLGSAAIVASDMDDRPQLGPWLASVYVHADYRRRGYGRALVERVMQAACEMPDVEKLYLFTPDQKNFYQSFGWQPLETCIYHDTQVDVMVYSALTWDNAVYCSVHDEIVK